MSSAWLIVKWLVSGLCALYFVLVCVALVRLRGEGERRAIRISAFALMAFFATLVAQDFFPGLVTDRAFYAIVGITVGGSLVALIRLMIRNARGVLAEG